MKNQGHKKESFAFFFILILLFIFTGVSLYFFKQKQPQKIVIEINRPSVMASSPAPVLEKSENEKRPLEKRQVRFIINELGLQETLTWQVIQNFPPSVTLAFMPSSLLLEQQIKQAKEKGFPVLLDFTYSKKKPYLQMALDMKQKGVDGGLDLGKKTPALLGKYPVLTSFSTILTPPFTPALISKKLETLKAFPLHEPITVLVPAVPSVLNEVGRFISENKELFVFENIKKERN